MYCRNCGKEMPDDAIICNICKTKKGEGTKFCYACGFHTSLKTEFCIKCGAKQKTIVTQKMKNEKIEQLQKYAGVYRTFMKIAKTIAIISITLAIILFIVIAVRPSPDNVPDPNTAYFREGEFFDDYIYSADYNVQEYWIQSRKLFMYIGFSLFVFIDSIIVYFIEKRKYKKTMRAIKEEKNVL